MRRIKHTTTVPTIPADSSTGTVGWFSKTGQAPTKLNPEWCNSVQGELYSFLQEVGATENQTDMTQVVSAAKNLRSKNLLLNGHMGFAKDVTSYTTLTTQYVLPRWKYFNNLAGTTHNFNRDSVTYTPAGGEVINTSASFSVGTIVSAYGASERQTLTQHIDGDTISALGLSPMVLSFWVRSSEVGTFAVALTNQGTGALPNNTPDKSFVSTYTVNVINTWERKVITIAAPTSWDFTATIGLSLHFVFGAGSSLEAPACNAWQTGHYLSTTGLTQLTDSTANTIKFTNVQLERGTIASNFYRQHQGYEAALINRYYQLYNSAQAVTFSSNVTSGSAYDAFYKFQLQMRATPTITLLANAANTGSFPATVGTVGNISDWGFTETRTASSNGNAQRFSSKWSADAEFYGN